jgi:hypothetical protein
VLVKKVAVGEGLKEGGLRSGDRRRGGEDAEVILSVGGKGDGTF